MAFHVYLLILLLLSLPVLLLILSYPRLHLSNPGMRYKISASFILISWFSARWIFPEKIDSMYWITGFLFIFAVNIFGLMVWSVLCWGYTLGMLLSLKEVDIPIQASEWKKLYLGNQSMDRLTENRLHLLIQMRFVKLSQHRLFLTKFGFFFIKGINLFARLYGASL